jgi:hypothetical protein
MTVLSEEACSEIIVTIFAVEQQEIAECLWWVWRICKKIRQFLESSTWIFISEDDGLCIDDTAS